MNIRQHTAAIVFLVFLIIGIIGVGLVIGRSRKESIVSSEVDITNDYSDDKNTGGLRRPPAPEIEDEDSFPSSTLSATFIPTINNDEQEQDAIIDAAPAAAPTFNDDFYSYFDTNTASQPATTTVHNVFVHPDYSTSASRSSSSIGSSDATSNSGGRSPLATFVEPTDIPTNSPFPTPLPTKLPTTMLPSGTPTTSNNNNNNRITYIYPENSMSPPRSQQRQPRGYFNYDSSQQSLYGPGYPVIGYDNKNELVVQYANNLWKLYRPPLPIPTSTAIAITNNLDNLDNDNTDYQNSPYNYYYWDEFGPNNYGFGP